MNVFCWTRNRKQCVRIHFTHTRINLCNLSCLVFKLLQSIFHNVVFFTPYKYKFFRLQIFFLISTHSLNGHGLDKLDIIITYLEIRGKKLYLRTRHNCCKLRSFQIRYLLISYTCFRKHFYSVLKKVFEIAIIFSVIFNYNRFLISNSYCAQ